jgi:uncharacterized membrane protein
MRNERGAITAFVTVFAFALLLVAGLVIDGGLILNARRTAFDEASAASRAGAQAVADSSLRSDNQSVSIDTRAATQRVDAYLAASGHEATTTVTGDTVTVEVQFSRPLTILGAVGVGPVTVHGRGEARSIRGLTAGDD